MATHPDLQAEQAYIDEAYLRLGAMRESLRERIASVIDQRSGTPQAMAERDIVVRTSLLRIEQLDLGRESLCFGRIDREASDGDLGESFYIGRLAVSGDDMEPLVVDWRAPVAEPFYRATGRHTMGLRRRRHFATDGARLLGIEDEVFSVDGAGGLPDTDGLEVLDGHPGGRGGGDGDGNGADRAAFTATGALLAALERSRSGHMRDIVATVQREQDEIIRAPLPGVLVVQGGPGTGKTAVALHRAAYLLYTHRFPLERQGVLVVGPNPVFLRYISQVLPSLGESGVALTTVEGLVPQARVRADDAPDVAFLKGDERMAMVLARAVRDRQRPLRVPLEVPYGSYLLRLTTDDSASVVAAARRRPGTHNARRRFVEAQVAQRLYRRLQDAADRALRTGVRPIGGDSGEVDGESFARDVRRRPEVMAALDRMWPRLLPEELLHDLYGAPALLHLAAGHALSGEEVRRLHRPRRDALDSIPWTPGDLPLLDEAAVLLGPVRAGSPGVDGVRTYGHIVVDEAQDLSPMQLRMLTRRSISGSMTVVGDIAQATGARSPSGWDEITPHLPARKPVMVAELSVNYRTPAEIMELAGRVLREAAPDLRPPRSARVTERPPAVVAAAPADLTERVVAEAAELSAWLRNGMVAVIAPDSLMAELRSRFGASGLPVGEADRDGLDRPITLVPVAEAKGLEFDGVIVVEPGRILAEMPQGLRSLYVALTRATQRLVVVHAEALPAPLQGTSGRG